MISEPPESRITEPANTRAKIAERKATSLFTWSGPALMLFARSIFSFLAQGSVAGIYALQSSPTPWVAAAGWFPVYATLIDAGCLGMLWALTRREGLSLLDLISLERRRWRRDVVLGLALVPVSLLFIFGGISISSLFVFGTTHPPVLFRPLPLLPAVYAVLVFPVIWGLTEQMTYNGYLSPRIQVLSGSTSIAVILVSFAWSFQHVWQPLWFDPDFMLYRLLAPVPHSVFVTLLYLRVRRLLPFAIAHSLMDGGDVFMTLLLPHLR